MATLRLALVIPLLGGLGLWLGYEAFRALRTGVANSGGSRISVVSRPWAFWLTIAVQAGFVVAFAVELLSLLRELVGKSA